MIALDKCPGFEGLYSQEVPNMKQIFHDSSVKYSCQGKAHLPPSTHGAKVTPSAPTEKDADTTDTGALQY